MNKYDQPLPNSESSPQDSQTARLTQEIARTLRKTIQAAKLSGRLTPGVIEAYAALHLKKDDLSPIFAAPHHRLWLELICDERIKKLLIIAPPESAKTTWLISAYLGAHVGFFPERSVIIGSVSGPVAEKRSMSLRATVESSAWAKTFPGILPVKATAGLKWEKHEWSLAPNGKPRAGRLHPTIAAYGTGGSVIGSRADLVIADDLLDFDNSRTSHQRELVDTWLHNSLLSRRKSRTGRTVMIGTAWHHDDSYSRARKQGGWVVCHIPLLSETNQVFANLTYPDDFPEEWRIGEPLSKAEL